MATWIQLRTVAAMSTALGVLGCASNGLRASQGASCQGTRTVVIHNGTSARVEVVTGVSGVPLGQGQVAEVVDAGQQSRPVRAHAGNYVFLRDAATGALIDLRRQPGLRMDYRCDAS